MFFVLVLVQPCLTQSCQLQFKNQLVVNRIMFAAPSANQQLHVYTKLCQKSWKDKMLYYQQLIKTISSRTTEQLYEVEICFLQMLKEKNLNVAAKVFDLLIAYNQIQPITKLQMGELIHQMFNFSAVPILSIQSVILQLFRNNDRRLILQALSQCCKSKISKRSIRAYSALRSILQFYGAEAVFWLQYNLEDVQVSFSTQSAELRQQLLNLFKTLYQKIGQKTLILAQTLNCPFQKQLNEYALTFLPVTPFEVFPEVFFKKKFDFLKKYSNEWATHIQTLKAKHLNSHLRQMLQDTQRNRVVQGDYKLILSTLNTIAQRKNHAVNKLIFGILKNISACVQLKGCSEQILGCLLSLASVQTLKHQLRELELNRQISFEQYLSKLSQMTSQTQYHQAIIVFQLIKGLLNDQKIQKVSGFFAHIKLNTVYRLQLNCLLSSDS